MGLEVAILAGLAVAGGSISKSQGGSFWKGATLGALTGGAGIALENMTGGHLTGVAAAKEKKKDEQMNAQLDAIRSGNTAASTSVSNTASTDAARQMLVSGGSQKLISSASLTGDTSGGGGSIRRRLMGG